MNFKVPALMYSILLITLFTVDGHSLSQGPQRACLPISVEEQGLFELMVKANSKLTLWLEERSEKLPGKTLYAPNMDGTYFYRLGKVNVSDRFSLGSEIREQKEHTLAVGFPEYNPEEVYSIAFSNNLARARAKPNSIRCAKHFPGGDESLELTESEQVLYSDPEAFASFISPFYDLLESPHAPSCLMVGHAQYHPRLMGLSESQNLGNFIGSIPSKDIPASLNPDIIKFARESLGFSGIIIGDWYNMWAIDKFLSNSKLPYNKSFLVFYLGLIADIDFIPVDTYFTLTSGHGLNIYPYLDTESENNDPPKGLIEDFNQRLDLGIWKTIRRLGGNVPIEKIQKLDLFAKLKIKSIPLKNYQLNNRTREVIGEEIAQKIERYTIGVDPWNRTGVLTMLQRQLTIEEMIAKSESQPITFGKPNTISEEVDWFSNLMSNEDFRKHYDAINWGSPETQNLFCHLKKHVSGLE